MSTTEQFQRASNRAKSASAGRRDMVALFKEMTTRVEDQPEQSGRA